MSPTHEDHEDLAEQVIYYCLRLLDPAAFAAIVDKAYKNANGGEAQFYQYLKQNNRIQSEFHVTLIHVHDRAKSPEIWQHYKASYKEALRRDNTGSRTPSLGPGDAIPECFVWDERIMAVAVREIKGKDGPLPCANAHPHVTIGTANDSIHAFESNGLLERWRKGDNSKGMIQSMPFPPRDSFRASVEANLPE
ncbi:tRNA ligase [Aspergillus leporis]|jgi:tRNA ligase|uniref:tRNA ligase n=1 Tax=Aspergillus leporis TaxID=41062 RepID=A0A5N5X8M2_9EURO|nr:tRNA ligase [Aspergillus leporis]